MGYPMYVKRDEGNVRSTNGTVYKMERDWGLRTSEVGEMIWNSGAEIRTDSRLSNGVTGGKEIQRLSILVFLLSCIRRAQP